MSENPPLGHIASAERPPVTPDHIWAIVGPSIVAACRDELTPHIIRGTLDMHEATAVDQLSERAQARMRETLEGAASREEAFVKSVSGAVLSMLNENPNADEYDVLFDLDETTARRGFLHNRALHAVRPSAAPLMATLRGIDSRIKFGVLSNRSEDYLERELGNPQELATLVPYLDPTKVLSSREIGINARVLERIGEASASMDVRAKVAACENLIDTSRNTCVLLVDDLADFKYVQADQHFRVLALDANSQFRF